MPCESLCTDIDIFHIHTRSKENRADQSHQVWSLLVFEKSKVILKIMRHVVFPDIGFPMYGMSLGLSGNPLLFPRRCTSNLVKLSMAVLLVFGNRYCRSWRVVYYPVDVTKFRMFQKETLLNRSRAFHATVSNNRLNYISLCFGKFTNITTVERSSNTHNAISLHRIIEEFHQHGNA